MKLFFALSDHSFGVGGMSFLNRQPRQGELRFRYGLLFSHLFAKSQRFLIRFARGRQVPAICKHIADSSQRERNGASVVNFIGDRSRLMITSKRRFEITTPSRHFAKVR